MQKINNKNKATKKQTTVFIGTPAYGSVIYTDYLHSIMSFTTDPSIKILIATLGNESLITRARNKLLNMFLNSGADYLLFLDADMGFNIDGLRKLIDAEKDLIGAPVRLKSHTSVLNCDVIKDAEHTPPLYIANRIGTAVMLISRELATTVAAFCKSSGSFYYPPGSTYTRGDNSLSGDVICDAFKVGKLDFANEGGGYNGEYLSEDYYFCKLAQHLGYDCFIHDGIQTVHNGTLQLPLLVVPETNAPPKADEPKLPYVTIPITP